MNYEHLRYLLEIKKLGSISKAAAYNFVSQPHLSTILQNFEQQIGFKLFIRTQSGVVVAPGAEDFFVQAQRFLEHTDAFEHYCESLTQDVFRLEIATVPFCFAEQAVGEMLSKQQSQRIEIRLREYHSFDIWGEITSGTYPLGFVSYNDFYEEYIKNTIQHNSLTFVECARQTPEIVLSKHHPALEDIKKDISKIQEYPAVMQTVVSEDVVNIRDMFNEAEIPIPKNNHIMTDHTTHLHFLSSGAGITITPHGNFYQDLLERYNLVGIPILELKDTISLGYVYNKTNGLTPEIKELIELWKKTVKQELQAPRFL